MKEKIKILLIYNKQLHGLAEIQLQSEILNDSDKIFFESFMLAKAFKVHEAVLLLCVLVSSGDSD